MLDILYLFVQRGFNSPAPPYGLFFNAFYIWTYSLCFLDFAILSK